MKIKIREDLADDYMAGGSDGFWYDLTKGGYFSPEEVMADPEQIVEMNKAIALVEQLEEIYERFACEC